MPSLVAPIHDELGFLCRFPLPPLGIVLSLLNHASQFRRVKSGGLIRLPYRNFCLRGVVLHEAMIAHELNRPVALVRVIVCWESLPNTQGGHAVNQDAVGTAELNELHQ
jgi:hypothetical protein